MKSFWRFGAVALLVMAGTLRADDSSLRQEIDDLRSKVASLESSEMAPAAGGDAASLTSMKKKGSIQIGGNVEMDVQVIHRDEDTAGDEVDSTVFRTADADLDFKVSASKDAYLYITLDLDDMWNQTADQDDLLEECYFMWTNVRGSAFDVRLGKGELAYGLDKDVVITDSYNHGNGNNSYLGRAFEAVGTTTANDHGNVGNFINIGEIDNVFMVEGTYRWKNLLKVEAALFQNNDTTGGGRTTRGMHEDRSDDTLFFQSYAVRATLTPIENLKLIASVVNQHNDSAGDDAVSKEAEEDQYSVSLAFDWNVKKFPLEIFGEYQHGWDYNYNDDICVDVAQIGAIYGITKTIDIIGEVEYMDIDSGDANNESEHYIKAVAAGKYSFDNGIYMMVEYCHEWYEADDSDRDADADVVSFRTGLSF
ncbi:MAG: hypothetical protein JXR97_16875 [Planctomycetes bacterium]|nr:hypothetical protein [Planctomycetota bacterium]